MKWILFILITCFAYGKEVVVQSKGAEIFCDVQGEGDPIVIIHGGPGLSHDYLAPLNQMCEEAQVIFYDHRACGRSTGEINDESISMQMFLEDLEAIRNFFGFKKMSVFGHSFGGLVAMKYALDYPERIDRLILANSSPASTEDFNLFVEEYMTRMGPFLDEVAKMEASEEFKNGDPNAIEGYYRFIFKNYCAKEESVDLLDLHLSPEAGVNGMKVAQILFKDREVVFDWHGDLAKLKIPTLIIAGADDVVPPVVLERIQQSIPDSQYVLIEECGHFPYVEKPEEFFNSISSFLRIGD